MPLIGAKPLQVLNVGLACQFQSYELVEMDEPEFQEFLQDAVDLIEFANGPADSTWGSVRAKMGHPEPFGLTMVGIGNEQWQTEKIDFFGRYQAFEKAIHAGQKCSLCQCAAQGVCLRQVHAADRMRSIFPGEHLDIPRHRFL